jgi:hypothetical protein
MLGDPLSLSTVFENHDLRMAAAISVIVSRGSMSKKYTQSKPNTYSRNFKGRETTQNNRRPKPPSNSHISPVDARKLAQSMADRTTGNTKPQYHSNIKIMTRRIQIQRDFGHHSPVLALFEYYLVRRTSDALPWANNELNRALLIMKRTPSDFKDEIIQLLKLLGDNVRDIEPLIEQKQNQTRKTPVVQNIPQLPANATPIVSPTFSRARGGGWITTIGTGPY